MIYHLLNKLVNNTASNSLLLTIEQSNTNKLKIFTNNYLLTGKKVKLFFPRQTRDVLLFERSENNSSRVCRGENTFIPVNT